MNLRGTIIARIQAKGPGPLWMLDAYLYLIDTGVARDEALDALKGFVNEIIIRKKARQIRRQGE